MVYLRGGPCNGERKPDSDIVGGLVAYVKCSDHYYTNTGTKRPNGDLIFADSGTAAPSAGSGSSSYAPNVTHSWSSVQNSVNAHLPSALHRIEYAMRRNLQQLSHRRRVR